MTHSEPLSILSLSILTLTMSVNPSLIFNKIYICPSTSTIEVDQCVFATIQIYLVFHFLDFRVLIISHHNLILALNSRVPYF